jgi:hypothetical protein
VLDIQVFAKRGLEFAISGVLDDVHWQVVPLRNNAFNKKVLPKAVLGG